jgi:hypothetical protein
MARCLSPKTSNYVMNVFCLLFSKRTEINLMFGLWSKLVYNAYDVLLWIPPLFFRERRRITRCGALLPKSKMERPMFVLACFYWNTQLESEYFPPAPRSSKKPAIAARMSSSGSGISKIHYSGGSVCSGSPFFRIYFDRDQCLFWLASSKSQGFRRHAFSSPALNIMTRSENIMTRSQKSMYGVSPKPLNDIQHGLVPLFFLFFKNCRHGTLWLLLRALQNRLIIYMMSLLARSFQNSGCSNPMSVSASVLSKTSTATGKCASRCLETTEKRKHVFPLSFLPRILMAGFIAVRFSKLAMSVWRALLVFVAQK